MTKRTEATKKRLQPVPDGDLLAIYDNLLELCSAESLHIRVRRLAASEVVYVIKDRPRSGDELYKVMMTYHGNREETEYQVKFIDAHGKTYRGSGRITLPDTRVQGQQSTQPPPAPRPLTPPATFAGPGISTLVEMAIARIYSNGVNGREDAIVLTHLETALLWINKPRTNQ